MGFLSHRVNRSEIKSGDHVYTWRAVFAYSHHGIYVGGDKVVHFTREENATSNSGLGSSFDFSSSSSNLPVLCTNFPDCGFRKPESGVVISCLDCFLGNGSLHLFEYGVNPAVYLAKFRGGTCTTAKSDPPQEVIHRAMHLLQNGFGNYDVFRNNCEDFALYCKTGLLIHNPTALGRSGQAACVVGAPLAAIFSSPLRIFSCSPAGAVAAAAGMYCLSRYATDVGVRLDVVKVKVEDMTLFHVCHEPVKELIVEDENETAVKNKKEYGKEESKKETEDKKESGKKEEEKEAANDQAKKKRKWQ